MVYVTAAYCHVLHVTCRVTCHMSLAYSGSRAVSMDVSKFLRFGFTFIPFPMVAVSMGFLVFGGFNLGIDRSYRGCLARSKGRRPHSRSWENRINSINSFDTNVLYMAQFARGAATRDAGAFGLYRKAACIGPEGALGGTASGNLKEGPRE